MVRVVTMAESSKARWQGTEVGVGGEYIVFKSEARKSELRALAIL